MSEKSSLSRLDHLTDVSRLVANLRFPVAVKTSGHLGRGVPRANVSSVRELVSVLCEALGETPHVPFHVEEVALGEHFRVYVLDGRVLRVVRICTAIVVGDGTSNLAELRAQYDAARIRIGLGPLSPPSREDGEATDTDTAGSVAASGSIPTRGQRMPMSPLSRLQLEGTFCHVHTWDADLEELVSRLPKIARLSSIDVITPDHLMPGAASSVVHDMHTMSSLFPSLSAWGAPHCPFEMAHELLIAAETPSANRTRKEDMRST